MAFKNYLYNVSPSNVSPETWVAKNVCVQLVTSYTYNSTHTTRADVNIEVGTPIAVTNKTVSYSGTVTSLSADNIAPAGTLNAKWAIFYEWNGSSAQDSDKILFAVDLNTGSESDVIVDAPLVFSSSGILVVTYSNA